MLNILIINHNKKQCGVYQYGIRLYDILKKSQNIHYNYIEIDCLEEYQIINSNNYNCFFYNYHSSTMKWLTEKNIQKNIKNIAVTHESGTINSFDYSFDVGDKNIDNWVEYMPRPIFENIFTENLNNSFILQYQELNVPIFGSFGFGFQNKGFHKIVKIINEQYDKAIIKFIIPKADYGFGTDNIDLLIKQCQQFVTKPDIILLISREFYTNEEILAFLASNTMNLFLYDKLENRGLSSALDYAMSVPIPFAISDSNMFRHIYSDEICVYKYSIKNCMENFYKIRDKMIEPHQNKYLIQFMENIFTKNKIVPSFLKTNSIMVNVSFGEAIDKLSILEIKMRFIQDSNKLIEIKKEFETLSECEKWKIKYPFFYRLLIYINQKIWELTDLVKSLSVRDERYSIVSKNIFDYNQKRFRIKNCFNQFSDSEINEQKSYKSTAFSIQIFDEESIYNKIAEINYLLLEYDEVIFITKHKALLKRLFINPNYTCLDDSENIYQDISNFCFPSNESKREFEFIPIKYLSGGLLGDFLQNLSVINEKFYETGQKGILYLSDKFDGIVSYDYNSVLETRFANGLDQTFNDIFSIIKQQEYILNFELFDKNQHNYDINLNDWRKSDILHDTNFYYIYKSTYGTEWGTHKWLKNIGQTTLISNDRILINTSTNRWPTNVDFHKLKMIYGDKLLFVCMELSQYDFFMEKSGITINYLKVESFTELCEIINTCYIFIGSLSMPLSIAHAMHKNRIIGLGWDTFYHDSLRISGLSDIWPNITYGF